MLLGNLVDIDVWRIVPVTGMGNWGSTGDPTYQYVHTFQGVIQPFEASDGLRNNQRFSNVRHLITVDRRLDIEEGDELVFNETYNRLAFFQDLNNSIIPHLEIYTTDSQWDRS